MQRQKRPLRQIFAACTVSALGACATVPGAPEGTFNERGVTMGEAELLKGVFGADFKTGNIRLRLHSHACPSTNEDKKILASVVIGDKTHADFWGPDNISLDYKNMPRLTSLFMHEAMHLFQNREAPARPCQNYDYQLTVNTRFEDLCQEQQAAVIEDYTDFFLVPRHSGRTFIIDITNKGDIEQHKPLIIKTVEDRFPDAKNLRLKMQEAGRKAKSCSYIETIIKDKTLKEEVKVRKAFDCGFYIANNP